ncbi:MAG: hypothetical protein Q8Q49_05530 [bacterium]|nr:hypothetical protein [bacterium]
MEHLHILPEEEQRKQFAQIIAAICKESGVPLSQAVIKALAAVDRRNFIPLNEFDNRFKDQVIPPNITMPSIMAKMLELALGQSRGKALEVGTRSGLNAAYMSYIFDEVFTIERNSPDIKSARESLRKEGRTNVTVFQGDGLKGLPQQAPFDAIIVTGGLTAPPETLLGQLSPTGRLVAPIGEDRYGKVIHVFQQGISEPIVTDIQLSIIPIVSPEQGGWHESTLHLRL